MKKLYGIHFILLVASTLYLVGCETTEDQLDDIFYELLYADTQVKYTEIRASLEEVDASKEGSGNEWYNKLYAGKYIDYLEYCETLQITTFEEWLDAINTHNDYNNYWNEVRDENANRYVREIKTEYGSKVINLTALYKDKADDIKDTINEYLINVLNDVTTDEELTDLCDSLSEVSYASVGDMLLWLRVIDDILAESPDNKNWGDRLVNNDIAVNDAVEGINNVDSATPDLDIADIIKIPLYQIAVYWENEKEYNISLYVYKVLNKLFNKEYTSDIDRVKDKVKEEEARKERERILANQASYTNGVNVGIAVGEAKFRQSLGYSYTSGNTRFLLVYVHARNCGGASHHVNPHDFTISDQWGNTKGYDSATYSLNNPFDAVDLPSGGKTSGWLAFVVNKTSDYYILRCDDTYGTTVDKKFIVP